MSFFCMILYLREKKWPETQNLLSSIKQRIKYEQEKEEVKMYRKIIYYDRFQKKEGIKLS